MLDITRLALGPLTAFLGLAVAGPPGVGPRAADPDRAAIRAVQKGWWDSLETVEFACFETVRGGGKKEERGAGLLYEFAQASGGRRSLTVFQVYPDGHRESVYNQKDDGRRSYSVEPFAGHPGSISRLNIGNQESGPDDYRDTMCDALALIIPDGRPVWKLLDEGAGLTTRVGEAGVEETVLSFAGRGVAFTCVLDPTHDWLPREVRLAGDSAPYWKVTQFVKEAGHWFPAAGISLVASINATMQENEFKVSDLRVNRPIPADRFSPPSLPDGALVRDSTGPPTQRIQGSTPRLTATEKLAIRQRHQARYTTSDRPAPEAPVTPIVADRDPPRSPWPLILGGLGLSTLVLTAILFFRGRGKS